MIDGTNLNQLTGSRQLLRAFGGINETYSCSEAELSAALNFSGRGFPALQTRALRKKVRDVEKVSGMYHLNGLLICRGTGLEYAPDGQTGRTAAVTLENVLTDDRKALAGMGSKVLIWPDRLAFDTETGQLEPLGAKWELGDRKMTVCPCDTEGKMYEVAGAGDTEPESPEDGQLFLKGEAGNLYDYESVLEKWSAKSGKWVQVLVNTVRMTCPGIGSLLKEGDTVTLTGMPQAVCDALAADLNGEIVVQALEGDDLVASLTPAQDSSRYYGSWTVTATGTSWRSLDGARTENEGLAVSITLERRVPELDFVTEQGNRVWGCSKKENTIYACRLGDPTNWYSYRGIASDSYAVSVGSDGAFTGAASCMGYVLFFKENCIHKLYGSKPSDYQLSSVRCRGVAANAAHKPVRAERDTVLSLARRGDGLGRQPAQQGVRRAGHREADGGRVVRCWKPGRAVLPVPAPAGGQRRAAAGVRHGAGPVARRERRGLRDGQHRPAAVPVGWPGPVGGRPRPGNRRGSRGGTAV